MRETRAALPVARRFPRLQCRTSHGQDNGRLRRRWRVARPEHPAILPHDRPMGGSELPSDRAVGCGHDAASRSRAPPTGAGCRMRNRRALSGSPPVGSSAAQSELFDQRLVAAFVLALQIVEQAAALRHQSEQATAGMIVLLVVLEVLGQVLDALGQNGDLYFRRPGVARWRSRIRFISSCLRSAVIDIAFSFLIRGNRTPTARMSSSRGQWHGGNRRNVAAHIVGS